METAERLVLTFLANAVWQASAVALAAWLLSLLLRNAPARHRHGLWVAALAASVLLPFASLLPASRTGAAPALTAHGALLEAAGSGSTAAHGAETRGTAPPPSRPARPSLPVSFALGASVMLLYAAFLILRAIRLALSWQSTRRLARSAAAGAPLPERIATLARRCRDAYRPAREVRVVVVPDIPGPVTFGARPPVIALPSRFASSATDDEILSALAHETAHALRRDFTIHVACELLAAPIAFHPAARAIARRIAQEREMACDDMAVERLVAPRAYAGALLSLSTHVRPAIAGAGLGTFDAGILEERMKRLVDRRPRPRARAARALYPAALGALVAVCGLASSFVVDAGPALAAAKAPGAHLVPEASDAGPASALEGHWTGYATQESERDIRFAELSVRIVDGRPDAKFALHKITKSKGETRSHRVVLPVIESRIESGRLLFTTDSRDSGNTKPRAVTSEWTFVATDEDEGLLVAEPNESFKRAAARGESVPPPPPPLVMKRMPPPPPPPQPPAAPMKAPPPPTPPPRVSPAAPPPPPPPPPPPATPPAPSTTRVE